MSPLRVSALLSLALVGSAAAIGFNRRPALAGTELSGGPATVFDATRDAFSLPLPGLSEEDRRAFFVGNSFFNQNWVSAPSSVTNRDGLGPLFNARSCSTCHFKDGRGRPPDSGEPMTTMLLRISRKGGRAPDGSPLADPAYGDQIQNLALPGAPGEAQVIVEYDEIRGTFADGEPYSLRRPRYRLEQLAYGPPAEGLAMSPRVAPALIGLGLLEAVPDAALAALADPDDRDGDGISGRQNTVWDAARRAEAVGRFGWKAEQPSVLQQTATALSADMGLTSTLFPGQNQGPLGQGFSDFPTAGTPEVDDSVLSALVLYAGALAVPARRRLDSPEALRGEALFDELGCGRCHVQTLKTGGQASPGALANVEFHPYTDLLLHDMGEALSDERPSFEAEGREWRTPPLWGLGLLQKVNGHTFLLHDGRARSVLEAVLWHGGEALSAKRAFENSNHGDRAAVLAFLESL